MSGLEFDACQVTDEEIEVRISYVCELWLTSCVGGVKFQSERHEVGRGIRS